MALKEVVFDINRRTAVGREDEFALESIYIEDANVEVLELGRICVEEFGRSVDAGSLARTPCCCCCKGRRGSNRRQVVVLLLLLLLLGEGSIRRRSGASHGLEHG